MGVFEQIYPYVAAVVFVVAYIAAIRDGLRIQGSFSVDVMGESFLVAGLIALAWPVFLFWLVLWLVTFTACRVLGKPLPFKLRLISM